jgi:hypothetical protein
MRVVLALRRFSLQNFVLIKYVPSARFGLLSEREHVHPESLPNKNEHMRTRMETNERNI